MRQFIVPTKDTTIYQAFQTNNAGLDEILEIGKVVDKDIDYTNNVAVYATASARALLYFELPTTESVNPNANYYLNLKLANANDVYRNQKVLVYPISSSWSEGSGYFYQQPHNVNDGATWKQSEPNISWSLAGGDFITSSTSASFTLSTYPLQDLRIDVTDIIRPYVSNSLQNTFNGLVVKFPDADENNTDNKGNIKVFSTQTHTIHQPSLEVVWNSQTFITGSILKRIPSDLNVKIVPNNMQTNFAKNDITRINLTVRDPFPLKSFDSTLRYKNKYYLPSSSYYSIVDVQSNVTVIPFDNYSTIDCDTNGSYIVLDTNALYSGRFYKVKIKVVSGSYTKTIDLNTEFNVL